MTPYPPTLTVTTNALTAPLLLGSISIDHVKTVMSRPRDSSTGPDGIPFSIYRSLVDTAAPLLYRYILLLSTGRQPNRSFNYTNLFLFLKDNSHKANRTRQISVSNTDNRIVANVVRKLISPAPPLNEYSSPLNRLSCLGNRSTTT